MTEVAIFFWNKKAMLTKSQVNKLEFVMPVLQEIEMPRSDMLRACIIEPTFY